MRLYNTPEGIIPQREPEEKRLPLSPFDGGSLQETLRQAGQLLLRLQEPEGYWWFTLEANASIDAGFIQLTHFLGDVNPQIESGLAKRIVQEQREDGTWGLYYGAPGDLSTTVECYLSLRLAGFSKTFPALQAARRFILEQGGLTHVRIFSRIHLALFGLVPWGVCPAMPPEMILLPPWAPANIYHFSSWARASIVPLLVVLNKKPVVRIPDLDLEELYVEEPKKRKWVHSRQTSPFSIEQVFLLADKGLKYLEKIPFRPWKDFAFRRALDWIGEHLQRTEDIYPAMAYGAMAFKAAGYAVSSPEIQTALNGLKSFHQTYTGKQLPPLPKSGKKGDGPLIHQQCCVSPVWDSPWSLTALLESGQAAPDDPRVLKGAEWILSKEVRYPEGDWRIKNPKGCPGGWSFEFKNDCYPDVDDTIQVLHVLRQAGLPEEMKKGAIGRGLAWLRSMQNDDGGWGAFDKNNDLELVNKIPFSDHGACLDPSTPDITGRALELLLKSGASPEEKTIQKGLRFLKKSQEKFGAWFGRWGVNYIYGTWCVLTALETLGEKNPLKKQARRACDWLAGVQNEDGGFSESPESYAAKSFYPYPESVASQTAWGLMGLIAGGRAQSVAAGRAADFLLKTCRIGMWDEKYFTGTGFPGHFYIRYHGYRYYFPLLALGRYRKSQ